MSPQPEQRISKERLHQIAQRKFQALAIPVQLDPAAQELRGEWRFKTGKVVAPGTQVRIQASRFRVEGHDHLVFLDPPLAALGPLNFYDTESADAFEVRVARAVSIRLQYLQAIAGALNARKIASRLDAASLILKAEVETTDQLFELEADPDGIRVVGIRSRLGGKAPVRTAFVLNLEEHESRSDLELFLSGAAQRGELGKPPAPGPAPVERTELELVAPPAGALTVQLLQRLGPNVMVQAPTGKLEVSQELRVGRHTFRFQAIHLGGTTFQGRLLAGSTEKWADRFDLNRFPGVEELARVCLGVTKEAPLQPRGVEETEPVETGASPGYLTPQRGEVWVMMVLVEREAEGEIRYTCADVDGRPYGATRLLKSDDFRATFAPHGPGWRLRIEVDRSEGATVVYRQVNPAGLKGPEKRMPLATLSTIFVPEASAY